MQLENQFKYDAFISYSHFDGEWVKGWLLPRLEKANLHICIDSRDFVPGMASIVNMENAVEDSKKTLIVLSPQWVNSEWANFESLLIQTDDPAGRKARMIPLMLKPCEPPKRIKMLTHLDFTNPTEYEVQLARLLASIKGKEFISYQESVTPSIESDQGSTSTTHWYDGLSPEQRDAVSHWGSSARILAGPGTGKTRCLIQRVAFLLQEKKIPKEQITVITFTRAATKELKDRLIQDLQIPEHDLPYVSTLHAFALKVLMQNHPYASLVQPLRVADDYEEEFVILPELANMLGVKRKSTTEMLHAFEALWHTLTQDQLSGNHDNQRFEESLRNLAEFYGFTLRSELIFKLKKLLEENPIIVEELCIKHLLVDEYQDLNYCDQQVIATLEKFGAAIFVTGDDDQSLYNFRHAYPDGIRNFVSQRPIAGDYSITMCHRCAGKILQIASALIAQDPNRVHKHDLVTSNSSNGAVHVLQFKDSDSEAKGIALICKKYVEEKLVKAREILVLLSSRSLASNIHKAIEKVGLDAVVLNPILPLDEETGRLIYCILRLLVENHDSLALRTWLSLQKGIGPETLNDLRSYCQQREVTLWDGSNEISENSTGIRTASIIKKHFDLLKKDLTKLSELPTLKDILDQIANADSQNKKIQNTRKFLDGVIADSHVEDLKGLILALQTIDLKAEARMAGDQIRIMTMHQAKGLSSELVIIPALENDLLPGMFPPDVSRRMLYVAMTRARSTLIMTHAFERTGSGSYLGAGQGRSQKKRSSLLERINIQSENGAVFVTELTKA